MNVKFRYCAFVISLCLLLSLAVVLFKAKQPQMKPCVHCNILLLDIDILRADALPCYGYHRNTAPNICSFAKKSVMFMDNYSTATWTLPSSFSTITSLYPTFHRIRVSFIDVLPPEIPTLAETLHQEGYQTALVGGISYSFINQDNGGARGYDLVTNQPLEQVISELSKSSKPWFIHYRTRDLHAPYLLPEGVKPMENLTPPKNLPITFGDYDRLLNVYLKQHYSEVFTKRAIDEYGSIILSPNTPNDTSVAELLYSLNTPQFRNEYLIGVWRSVFDTYMETFDTTKPSDVAYVRMMYDTKLKLIDDGLRTIFQQLSLKPLAKNTVTVLMSDHGENFGEHGKFSHENDYHSEMFYTPLIIHSPQLSEKQVYQPSGNIDIFPTILDLVGLKPLAGLQGHSLVSDISNPKLDADRFILSEDETGGIILQNRNWLYFLSDKALSIEESVLYDRTTDPLERENVAVKYPDLTNWAYKQASLIVSYNDLFSDTQKIPEANEVRLDSEKVKQFRKEGYF